MASNQIRYVGSIYGADLPPLRKKLLHLAGSTPLKQGEFLELSGSDFIALASDKSMSGTVAISDAETRAGDLAGYRYTIIPRPGDLFVVPLSAAGAPAHGAAVYWASSQSVATSGSNILGYVQSDSHIPEQGFNSLGEPNAGTTLTNVEEVVIEIKKSVSVYATRAA